MTTPSGFLYGTQYWRDPSPRPAAWESDLAHIRQLGLDAIKIWITWQRVEAVEGKFDFHLADRLFELAQRHGLTVIPQLSSGPPAWYRRQWPDFYTSAALSLDNPEFVARYGRFVRETVERFRSHPSLLAWDCWNEPVPERNGSPPCLAAFREYLRGRYGTPAALAEVWGVSDIVDWTDIELPHPHELPASLDHYRFRREHFPKQLAQLAAIYQATDPQHPVMMHDVFSGLHGGYSDYHNSAVLPVHGVSLHVPQVDPAHPHFATQRHFLSFCLDVKTHIAGQLGRPLWVSELFAGPQRFTVPSAPPPAPGTVRTALWESVAAGATAAVFWQFRPERYTFQWTEDAGWGMVGLDGRPLPRTAELAEFGREVRALTPYLPFDPVRQVDVAIVGNDLAAHCLNSRRQPNAMPWLPQYVQFEYHDVPNPHAAAALGVYRALRPANVSVAVINADDPSWEKQPRVYFPLPMQLDAALAERLQRYVSAGGLAVIEGGLGFYGEDGWVSERVPACGLDEVFGVRELESEFHRVRTGFSLADGSAVPAAWRTAQLEVAGAEVLGRFADGSVAAVERQIGNGRVIYLASSPSLAVYADPGERGLGLVRLLGCRELNFGEDVELRRRTHGTNEVVFVFNHSRAVRTVSVPLTSGGKLTAVIRGRVTQDGEQLQTTIPPHDVAVGVCSL